MVRWYAVADAENEDPEARVWTVSKDPNQTGWETESGVWGYGLLKIDAEFLAAAANEKLERDGNA